MPIAGRYHGARRLYGISGVADGIVNRDDKPAYARCHHENNCPLSSYH